MTHSHRKHLKDQPEETETEKPSANTASHRRPHKNLVRYWQEHTDDYEEIDEFFAR